MSWKRFFKPIKEKIIITIIIFILLIIFFLPAKMNVMCKVGVLCPPENNFIKLTEISTARFVSLNYIYLVIELIAAYIVSRIIIVIYKKLRVFVSYNLS